MPFCMSSASCRAASRASWAFLRAASIARCALASSDCNEAMRRESACSSVSVSRVACAVVRGGQTAA